MVEVSINPETVFHLGPVSVTNTLLTAWVVMFVLIAGAVIFSQKKKELPGKLQNFLEAIIEFLLNFMETIGGNREKAERFFPIVATLFLFVLLANWAGVLPGFGSIGIKETAGETVKLVPLFRSVHSDLNMTLALATLTVVLSHFFGIVTIGVKKHLIKFLNFKSPVAAFSGILEIVSEFAKVVSLSFRLFGNVFAGEVLLTIVAFLTPYLVPVPFLGMELFVGFIQALIFAVLAMVAFSSFTKVHGH
jgi:F-type H+-transporting ATPase subunit a